MRLSRLQLPVETPALHQAIAQELEIADFASTVFASTDALTKVSSLLPHSEKLGKLPSAVTPAPPQVSVPMLVTVAFALKAPVSTDALMISSRESQNSSLLQLSAVTYAVHLLTAPMLSLADYALTAHASTDAENSEIFNITSNLI